MGTERRNCEDKELERSWDAYDADKQWESLKTSIPGYVDDVERRRRQKEDQWWEEQRREDIRVMEKLEKVFMERSCEDGKVERSCEDGKMERSCKDGKMERSIYPNIE